MESLKNKTINLLNLHSGLQRFSSNIFDVFGAVYLLQLGMSFTLVTLTWAGSCFLRALLRPFSLLLCERIGLRKTLIIGIILNSALCLFLLKVNGLNFWLFFYIFYIAICDIFYWLPYHAYYAKAGDECDRGKQVGVKHGLITFFRMLSPLIGAIFIVRFGFSFLYVAAALVMLGSVIPILFARDVSPGTPMKFKEALKTIDKHGFMMQIGDGILFMHTFVWTIVLFYLVGDYVTFGGLVTIELVSTMILFMVLGYMIDKGKGGRINHIGLIIVGVVILLRAFIIRTIPAIIISDVLIAFGLTFFTSSYEVGFYDLSKETANTLWFQFFGELGWDIGAFLALLLSVGLFMLGVPLRSVIAFSVIGLWIIYRALKGFYARKT